MPQTQWRSDDTEKWPYGFGTGIDGDLTINSNTSDSPIDASCSGTAGAFSLTATNASFAAGQFILIHQTRGTGAGSWELNKIASYVAGTITTQLALKNTYTDSGASQAQVLVIKQYNNVTVNSTFTYTGKGWTGDVGGIMVLWAKTAISIAGTLSEVGSTSKQNQDQVRPDNGGGFRGGWTQDAVNSTGLAGEGQNGDGTQSSSANGMGGGAGGGNANYNNGGGGGHATAGTAGSGSQSTNGAAGGTGGAANLTTMLFGGGGGGATGIAGSNHNCATNGGGIIILIAPSVTITGAVSVRGGSYAVGNYPIAGGGGAGGSVLIKCMTATLGTNLILATGGTTTHDAPFNSGDGGNGRIHIDYSVSYTGSTNPTIDASLDTSIVNPAGGGFILMMA